MARIPSLPSLDIIRGFKGILDFYLWRGLPCVRAWPAYRPARQTPASLAAALLFGAIIKAFSLTHGTVLEQLAIEATGIPRTTRDIYVSGVFGNLHEASMSDFLDLLTQCRDFLSNLTDLLHALDSIDTDELVVNVDQSVLPPLAATTTNQATAITALQNIDDLQDALESKALDRLLVRGMDQLYSISGVLSKAISGAPSGANGYRQSSPVPAGLYWLVTGIAAWDATRNLTAIHFASLHDATTFHFAEVTRAIAAGVHASWSGHVLLDPDDRLRIYFIGALAGDTVHFHFVGHTITKET